MSLPDLNACQQVARDAAVLAWKEIEAFFRGKFKIYDKVGDGPATEADILADKFIVGYLREKMPGKEMGFLSEETEKGLERLGFPYCWVIDPIDGTREFIEGGEDFAMHVGLAGRIHDSDEGSVPLVGVVYLPRRGLIYRASHGEGAFVEDLNSGEVKRVSVTPHEEIAQATLIVTRQSHGRRLKAAIDKLQVREIIQRGSFGVKVMDVVSGQSDLYLNTSQRHCKEWDSLAPHAILNEAGGKMTDLRGEPILYNREDVYLRHGVIGSNGALHEEVIRHLSDVRELWKPSH